tara:strand:+ start:4283 stop:4621 length:339 start_codon:yes stop_codon:yes gene_type:complete
MEYTFAEETLNKHLALCNEHLCEGHKIVDPSEFNKKIGDLVVTSHAKPRNIIGCVYGYIYSPFTDSVRAVLGVNCDIMVSDMNDTDLTHELAFNMNTVDFAPVEARYTVFFK